MGKISLLDCTLRDGGYINNWRFGHDNIVNIFERLVSSKVDMIEIGFMDERRGADCDYTIQPGSRELEGLYEGLGKGQAMVVGMIDYGTCGIERLQPHSGQSVIDGIRIIFKKDKRKEALEFCSQVKELGYKVFAQAVSITSYNDEEMEDLIHLINELEPYAFSLVDTYGLLHKKQLMHYFSFADERLKKSIGLGYHSHNNFQLGYANCIELLEQEIERDIIIDGSLYGMGKSAGNTPIELLATYMNDVRGTDYKLFHLLEAIDVTILDIFKKMPWGYSFKFFLSAANDCHPNYVSYLMEKKKLSVKSIDEVLHAIPEEQKLNYDAELIERLYAGYQKTACDDSDDFQKLQKLFFEQKILLLAPGPSIEKEEGKIEAYKKKHNCLTISVNFMPEKLGLDYVFISNAKRYVQLSTKLSQIKGTTRLIATSNVTKAAGAFDFIFSYDRLLDEQAMIIDNPMIMLMRLLNEMKAGKIVLAGFDGYTESESANYINPNMEHTFSREKAKKINEDVKNSLKRLGLNVPYEFLTETLYET